jgi:7-carboxy-7-deazaguanine synthase
VVITGGEPMIFEEIGQVCIELRRLNRHITIETAGTVHRDWVIDLWSISPKLSNSTPIGYATDEWVKQHDERRQKPEVVQQLMDQGDYQLKFVVGSILDAEEVLEYLSKLQNWDRERVMLMPRGTTVEEMRLQSSWLTNWCRDHDLRMCDRSHIYWFGNRRGT